MSVIGPKSLVLRLPNASQRITQQERFVGYQLIADAQHGKTWSNRCPKLLADVGGSMIPTHGTRSHSASNTRSILDGVARREIPTGNKTGILGAGAAACIAQGPA
jgi:hypothetical protein